MAFAGGYFLIEGAIYDGLLSITLIWASVRLFRADSNFDEESVENLPLSQAIPAGAGIGLLVGLLEWEEVFSLSTSPVKALGCPEDSGCNCGLVHLVEFCGRPNWILPFRRVVSRN